jgi:hypothetical protein
MNNLQPLTIVSRVAIFIGVCIFSFITICAQTATATLSGTIEDQNGASIPGVLVTIENIGTTLKRETTTNESGYFSVPLLTPGRYVLTARRDGFMAVQFPDITLNVGDQKTLEIRLNVGDVKETVNISGEAPLINESPAVSTVVDRQFVENMPLNGRSFQTLINLTPGVVATVANASEGGQFSVNGQRADANYFMVDGVSANIAVSPGINAGQHLGGSLPGLAATGGTNNLVSVDALEEFKVLTSTYAPEYGRMPGAQVSIITRSGTNKFHGKIFDYLRNDVLDANDWFANSRGLRRPPLRQNDFGGVLGGPIIKNRSFFFFSYEGLQLRQPQVGITDVPSLQVRQTAPVQLQPFLNAFPLPNGPNRNGANGLPNGFAEFAASYSNPSSLNATSIRVDYAVNNRFNIFGRANFAPSETIARTGSGSSLNNLNTTQIDTRTLTVGATNALASTITNEFRINYSRNLGQTVFALDDFGGGVPPPDATLFPSFTSHEDALLGFVILGGTNSVFLIGLNSANVQRQINVVNNLTWVTGAHQAKFGIDYRRLATTFGPRSYSPSITFSSIGLGVATPPSGSVLSGRISSGSILSFEHLNVFFDSFSVFGQDTWRLRRRLTLTYGLRWELNPPPNGENGKELFTAKGLDNLATVTLAPQGTPLYQTTYGNFAPRIGVSYQLSERQGRETVVRGGFGIFYDLGNQQSGSGAASFPYLRSKIIPAGSTFPISDPGLAAPPAFSINPPYSSVRAFDPRLKLPRTYQWNFAVEQSLGSNQAITASYIGAVGRNLLRSEIILRPNTNFAVGSFLTISKNTATSDYHAAQFQFRRRLTRGLQALASYTWSHSIDIFSGDANSTVDEKNLNLRQERGASDFDVRHAVSAAVSYNVPTPFRNEVAGAILRNWSIDSLFTARSSTPVDITSRRDIGFGTFSFRPDVNQGVPLYIADPLSPGGKRINPAAFTIPSFPAGVVGRQGTLGRNVLRGFPLWQIDFALVRKFKLREGVSLQLRGEFFNLVNHPNFGNPIGVLTNALFGRSTSMFGRSLGTGGGAGGFNPLYQVGGPRSTQLALKLEF